MVGTHKLIGFLVMLVFVLAVVLSYVLGRQSERHREDKSAIAVSSNKIATLPVQQPEIGAAKNDPASRSWIIGDWAEEKYGCATDAGDSFKSDGSYGSFDQEGKWSLKGNTITQEIAKKTDPDTMELVILPNPEIHRIQIQRTGKNRMIQTINGKSYKMIRC